MKIQDQETKEKLIQRLRRIEGQVRGVEGMLEDGRDCREILQQLAAIHSAVQSASRIFLQEYATSCLGELDDPLADAGGEKDSQRANLVRDILALLDKVP